MHLESPGSPIFKMKGKSTKRFGARYGGSVKHNFAKIEALQKTKYKCPYCHYFKVKRLSTGLWFCSKCNAKFTGKAYTILKKVVVKEETKEVPIKEDIEEEDFEEEHQEKTKKTKKQNDSL